MVVTTIAVGLLSWLAGPVAPPMLGAGAARCTQCRMEEPKGAVFRTPKSTDTAAEEQAARAKLAGLTPQAYEEATRRAGNEHLSTKGAHIAASSPNDGPPQRADFTKQLWDVASIPAVPAEAAAYSANVLATVYEIVGPLTGILSTSVAKKLPLIPHVGTSTRIQPQTHSHAHAACRACRYSLDE